MVTIIVSCSWNFNCPFLLDIFSSCHIYRNLSSLNSFDFDQSRNLRLGKEFNLYQTIRRFNNPWKKQPFENIVGKGENAGDQHFLLFSQCFLLRQETDCTISAVFNLSSANAFNLDQDKILFIVEELTIKLFICNYFRLKKTCLVQICPPL